MREAGELVNHGEVGSQSNEERMTDTAKILVSERKSDSGEYRWQGCSVKVCMNEKEKNE